MLYSFLGLIGGLKRDKKGKHTWGETCTSKLISLASAKEAKLNSHFFSGFTSFALSNGNMCSLDSWVIPHRQDESMSIGRVVEILQIVGSSLEFSKNPDYILISLWPFGRNLLAANIVEV